MADTEPIPTPSTPAPPKQVGPYELEERLGAGGMGEVFQAYDRRLDRRVALKHVRPEAAESASGRARLRREAWAVARLSHPYILQIFDILELEGGDWIVMELVDGPTIAELLAAGPLDPLRALRLAEQVAEGLAEAHDHGILHRDLKAENVMVTRSGHPKILDFGLAKPLWGQGTEPSLSVSGAVMGTARAMSPEQARGRRVGPRSDLFSLGVLIYEMVAGASPFACDNLADTLTRVCTHQPPPLSGSVAGVPEELSGLVDELLAKMPEMRPADGRDVAERLGRLASQLGSETELAASGVDRLEVRSARNDRATLGVGGGPATALEAPSQSSGSSSYLGRISPSGWARALLVTGLLAALLAIVPLGNQPDRRDAGVPGEAAAGGARPARLASTAFDHLRQGQQLLERYDLEGHIEGAIEAFQRALAARSGYAPAYAGLSRAYWRQYRFKLDPIWLDRAFENASRAVDLDPEQTYGRVSLALVRIARGQPEARAELEDVLRLDPQNADAHRGLADLARRAGEAAVAREHYLKAIELAPEDWELPLELAVLEQRHGRYDEAQGLLEAALARSPDNPLIYLSLGGLAHFRGDYGEAARRFQESIEIRPLPAAYSNLGTLYFFQGLYQEAVTALRRAVELGAHGPIVWANLGDAYRWTPGNRELSREAYLRAIQLLRREVEADPEAPGPRSRLALTLAKRGDRGQALAELSEVLAEDSASILYRVVLTYEVLGDRERALAALDRALAAGYSLEEVENDPELTALREDVRFHHLLVR